MGRPKTELPRALVALARLAAVACILLAPALAHGDVNVEARRPKPSEPGFDVELQTRFAFRQGNINLLDVGGLARMAYSRRRHLVFYFHDSALTSRTLGRTGGAIRDLTRGPSRFANRHMGHARYSLRLVDWLRIEAFTQLQADEFLLTRLRWLNGLGLRFTVFETEGFGLYTGPAYLAEYEALDERVFLDQPTAQGPKNVFHRLGTVLTLSLQATKRLGMHSTTYFQPRFDAPRDFIVLNDNALIVELVEHLELKLLVTVRHDHTPPSFCAIPLQGGSCGAGMARRLIANDVALQNALAARF